MPDFTAHSAGMGFDRNGTYWTESKGSIAKRFSMVVFEKQRSAMWGFRLNGAVVERVDKYKYLGLVFHATKGLHSGTEALMAVARKALFTMQQCCGLLGIRDPALQCKLFDTLVLPILSYGCEVWGVDAKCGAAAKALHKGFMKSLLCVRNLCSNPHDPS